MSEKKPERREFLFTASYAVGAVGVGAVVWPLIDQMNPDASVKALASTEVDVSSVKPGNTITVLWRGKPVFIRRRTQEEISEAKSVKMEDTGVPAPSKHQFTPVEVLKCGSEDDAKIGSTFKLFASFEVAVRQPDNVVYAKLLYTPI